MPFKPGQSGNPTGRTPGTSNLPKEYEGMTHKQIFRKIAIHKAIPLILKHIESKDSIEAAKIALEYGFGKPIQQINAINVNMDYSNWTNEQIEEFEETNKMPMIAQGEQESDQATGTPKRGLNDKNKEVK